jgi:hypothetical protein
MGNDLELAPDLPVHDDKALRRQLHAPLLGLINMLDAASIQHADDRDGQARLLQVIDMMIRDLRLVRADAAERCANAFPVYEKGKAAGKPMGKVLIDGIGEVRRSAAGSWKDPDWDTIQKYVIAFATSADPETGELPSTYTIARSAVGLTLACTGRSSIRVGGVEALNLEMENVARRDDARPTVTVPSLGDWDV